MRLPAAVIFDFDGIILDSESPEFEAHRRIFDRCGASLTREQWCDQIGVWIDGQAERWFERLRGMSGAPETLEAFEAEKRRMFQELVSSEPMPGIVPLIDALAARAVPIGVASTSPSRWVVPSLERLALRDRFAAVVTADDVERRKPAPDVYLEAARRLGADPNRSVAIEDSGPGVKAAKAAGMKAIAIPHWLTESHDFRGADLIVSAATELTAERIGGLL